MMSAMSLPCHSDLQHQYQKLKQREKEMEQLFTEQDEDSQRRINELKNEQKKLLEKTDSLELQLMNVTSEKEELAEKLEALTKSMPKTAHSQQCSSNPQPIFIASQSSDENTTHLKEEIKAMSEEMTDLQNDYAELQEKYDTLNVQKLHLQDQLDEVIEKIKEYYETIDTLEIKCATQEEIIVKLNQTNGRLVEENRDLYESANHLQTCLDSVSSSRSSSVCGQQYISLSEELEEAKINDHIEKEYSLDSESLPSLLFEDDHIEKEAEYSQNFKNLPSLLIRLIYLCIFIIIFYVTFCVHQELPVFFFVNSKNLIFRHFTNGMPPM